MDYNLSTTWTVALVIAVVWELIWKGFALWKAARRDQPYWYAAILLMNTMGILPIAYLLTHKGDKS